MPSSKPRLYRDLTREELAAFTEAVLKNRESINAELSPFGIRVEDIELPTHVVARPKVVVSIGPADTSALDKLRNA